MPRISNEIIQNIVQSNDIVDVLRDFIELHKKGQSYVALCPFHNDTNPSMSIDSRKQIFKCFVCNTGGDALKFLRLFKKWNVIDSLKYLADKANIDFDPTSYQNINDNDEMSALDAGVYDILDKVNSFYKAELIKSTNSDVKKFLTKRHLSYTLCKQFDIGYAPVNRFKESFSEEFKNQANILVQASLINPSTQEPFFKNRIIFAIRDENNKVVGFSARALDDSKPKYINSAESKYFRKSNILYNLNNVYSTGNFEELIITEGFFDVIALSKANLNNAICLMGTTLTREHISKLYKFKKIIIFLDGDEPGQDSSYKTVKSLLAANYKNIYVVKNTSNYDPDEILNSKGEAELKKLINDASPFIYFIYDYLRIKHGFYDGLNSSQPTDIQFERFGSEFYPIWKKLDIDVANAFNEKIKNDYKRDINLIIDKSQTLGFTKEFNLENSSTFRTNFYDEPTDVYDFSYYDNLVDSQTFDLNNDFRAPYLATNRPKIQPQSWIEKMLIIVLNFPELIKLFKINQKNKPLESINFYTKNNEEKGTIKQLYNYFMQNSKFTRSELDKLAQSLKELGKDKFMNNLYLKGKTPKELEESFNEIYERAIKEDLINCKNFLVENMDAMKNSPNVEKEVLDKIREIKLKIEGCEYEQ
ncbi:DNA primase [Mycoplasmopsis primatum]|uniref:DNA primase n=1 Tax=Mycoplasmopsis primatum TaxID=55604 RepID=UPI000495D7A0|nr:DNA primase [Mycoplasmopsis primatum]